VGRHDAFITLSSLAFAILFTERGIYAHLADGERDGQTAALVLALGALVIFGGFLASFYVPPLLCDERDRQAWHPHTLAFLLRQYSISVMSVVSSSLVTLGLYMYLVYPNLLAMARLLWDTFMYMALGVLVYHGFVTFARYLGFLYQTGGADKTKVIAFESVSGLFLCIVALYQHTVDLVQVMQAGPEQGLLALHLTVRDIWLAVMIGYIFVWQLGRVGDH